MRPLAIPFRGRILGYPMVLRPASATQTPLLLDLVTGAAAAYSLRKLRNAYAGSAVRVRRSSDNSEQDIGFSGNDFDTSAFSSFIGGGSGYVATWYDQSGNANNATQSTAANQAQIILSAQNGKAGLLFNGTSYYALTSTLTASPFSGFAVIKPTATSERTLIAGNSASLQWRVNNAVQGLLKTQTGNVGIGTITLSSSAYSIIDCSYDGTNFILRANGGGDNSGTNTVTFTDSERYVGARNTNLAIWSTHMLELVVYTSALALVNLQMGEVNINTYYAIY